MKILRTGSLGSNFTGSYKRRVYLNRKKETITVIKGVLYRSGDASCFFLFSESPIFFCQIINKTKLSITNFQKQNP